MLSSQSQSRKSALFDESRGQTFDVSDLVDSIAKDEDDLISLSKTGEVEPLQMIDITDYETTVVNEKRMQFKALHLKTRPRGLMITPGADLPPSKFVLDTAYMHDLAEQHRKQIEKEIEAIDVAFYAKHLRQVKLQKELAKFETRAKNLIYLGATKLAYIGIMTYAGPIAITFFLNHICALTAPLGAANVVLQTVTANFDRLNELKETVTDASQLAQIEQDLGGARSEKIKALQNVNNLQSELDNSMTMTISKFVMEALFGMTPVQMQTAENFLKEIQSHALKIFSDPNSKNLDPSNLVQSAFGGMNLFGFTQEQGKAAANLHTRMPALQTAVINLKNALITSAAGPLASLFTSSPSELLKREGLTFQDKSEESGAIQTISQIQSWTNLPLLNIIKYGVKFEKVATKLYKAQGTVMNYYRDYTYEINNVVGIFTGANKEYDDPDYITKHFNSVVKRPFNSMALRNGIVGKIENYIFGKTGPVAASASADRTPKAAPAVSKVPSTYWSPPEPEMSQADAQPAPPPAQPPAPVVATHKEGLWAFFDIGPVSEFFKAGYDVPGQLYKKLKNYTVDRLTPRNCVGTAAGAFYDSITHSIYTQVEGFLPEERKDIDKEEENEKRKKETEEYEEGLRAQRIYLIKQGKSGDALVNIMRETAITSDPAYVMNAQDHNALEYAWIKVQKKAKELQKRGVLSELFLLWGASGSAQLFGMMASHALKPGYDTPISSIQTIDWYTMGPNTFIDMFVSYKTANAELMMSNVANELKEAVNKIHSEVYDEYIRKPALNSDLGKWLQKNIKNKSKDLVKKVMGRIYLSTYINQVWNKIVDIVFDTLINLPLNIPNSVITNMQYDFVQKFGINNYMTPQGWRFVMDNLTLSNIQSLYTRISWGLRNNFSLSKSTSVALAGESLASHMQFAGPREVYAEGFENLAAALGPNMYQSILGLSQNSQTQIKPLLARIQRKRDEGASNEIILKEFEIIEIELTNLMKAADKSAAAQYKCIIDYLKGQRLLEEAKQNNMKVEDYIQTKYALKQGETVEGLLKLAKLDNSSLPAFLESTLSKALYDHVRPTIGERRYVSSYTIPLGAGLNVNIKNADERADYKRRTNEASLISQMTLRAVMDDRTIDEALLIEVANTYNIDITAMTAMDKKQILQFVASDAAQVAKKELPSDAEVMSELKDLFDNRMESINDEFVKRQVPEFKITDMPFLYFKIGEKTYRYHKYDKQRADAEIQENNKKMTQLEEEMNKLEPSSPTYIAKQNEYKKLYNLNNALSGGPRTTWEKAFNMLLVEASASESYLSDEEKEKVKHKDGFAYNSKMFVFDTIDGPQKYISTSLLGTELSPSLQAGEKIIIRKEMYGIFGNYFTYEVIDALQFQQQMIASSTILSMIGSEGFELLDKTSKQSKLYKLLQSQLRLNPSFLINLVNHATGLKQNEHLQTLFYDKLNALKKSDPGRFNKIDKQLKDIENGVSNYIDKEFLGLYNAMKQSETDAENAKDAALAALPDNILKMINTNKRNVLKKHQARVNKQKNKIKKYKKAIEDLKKCVPPNQAQQSNIDEINKIHSKLGTLHEDTHKFFEGTSQDTSQGKSQESLNTLLSASKEASKTIGEGCASQADIDAMEKRVSELESLVDDVSYDLSEAMMSDGLNISIHLHKLHNMELDSTQLAANLKTLLNTNSVYKDHLDSSELYLKNIRLLYIDHLTATAIKKQEENNKLATEGLELVDPTKDGLNDTVRAQSKTKIYTETSKIAANTYNVNNLQRSPSMSDADYITHLETQATIIDSKNSALKRTKIDIELMLASLKGGVMAVNSILSIETQETFVFDLPTETFESKFEAHVSEKFSTERSSLNTSISEYNKNIARIKVLQTNLATSTANKPADYKLSASEQAMLDELIHLLKTTTADHEALKRRYAAYTNDKPSELASVKGKYLQSIKDDEHKLTHITRKDGVTEFRFPLKSLQKRKRELLNLMRDLTVIQDTEKIEIVKKQIAILNKIIDNRETIQSMSNTVSNLTSYTDNDEKYLATLRGLIADDTTFMAEFDNTLGAGVSFNAYTQSLNDKIDAVYTTERNLAATLIKAAYDKHGKKRVDAAKNVLERYKTLYGDNFSKAPPHMNLNIRTLQNIVNGITPLVPIPSQRDVENPYARVSAANYYGYPTFNRFARVGAMNIALHNFIHNNQALADVDVTIKQAEDDITSEEAQAEASRLAAEKLKKENEDAAEALAEALRQAEAAEKESLRAAAKLAEERRQQITNGVNTLNSRIITSRRNATKLIARLTNELNSTNPNRTVINKLNADITAIENKIQVLLGLVNNDAYTADYKLQEIGTITTELDTFDTLVTTTTTNLDTIWLPTEEKATIKTSINDSINGLEDDIRNGEAELKTLKAELEKYEAINKNTNILSVTTVIDALKIKIGGVESGIQFRRNAIAQWKVDLTAAETKGLQAMRDFKTKFNNEKPTATILTDAKSIDPSGRKRNEINEYFRAYIRTLRNEQKAVNETISLVTSLRKAKKERNEQGFWSRTFGEDKTLGKETTEILEDYEYKLTAKNTTNPAFVGKTRFEVLQLQSSFYADLLDNRTDEEILERIGSMTDQNTPTQTIAILRSAGQTAERERNLTSAEVADLHAFLNSEIDRLNKELKDHMRNRKSPLPTAERKPNESEEDKMYHDLKDQLAQMNTYRQKLMNMYALNVTTNTYELRENVSQDESLSESEINILKAILLQARRAKNTQLGNVEIYKYVFRNAVRDAELFAKYHTNESVDKLDPYNLDWLLYNYEDTRNVVVEGVKIAGATAAAGSLLGLGVVKAAKASATALHKKFGTKTPDPFADAAVASIRNFNANVKAGTQYLVDKAGVVIGHVTAAGTKVWNTGVAVAEGAYSVVKPAIDATTKFVVDTTGAIVGFVSETGQTIWTAGKNVADKVYSTIEPAINKAGEIIGWTFDKLAGATNVVIDLTGKCIGYLSDQLGMIINEAGELIGTTASFVWDQAGNLVGKMMEFVDPEGKIVKAIVDVTEYAKYLGNKARDAADYAISRSLEFAVGASAVIATIYKDTIKKRVGDAWEVVKDKTYVWYQQSYLKKGVDVAKAGLNAARTMFKFIDESYKNMKTAWQETTRVTRAHAQRAFRIEFIIDNFFNKNEQALKDSNVSLDDWRTHLRNCLRSQGPCGPMPENVLSSEAYNTILPAAMFAKMQEQNTNASATDYSVTVFLDAVYNQEKELSLGYTGFENQDIGSRIDEFIGRQKLKNASLWDVGAYRALETAEASVGLIRYASYNLGVLGGGKLISSGFFGITNMAGYTTVSEVFSFAGLAGPAGIVMLSAAAGGGIGYGLGTGLAYVLEAVGVIEGTDMQKKVLGYGGATVGAIFGATVGYSVLVAGVALGAPVLLAAAAVTASVVIVAGLFALAASSFLVEGLIKGGEKLIVSKVKREGETDEQAIKRMQNQSRRAFLNLANFTSSVIFRDSNGNAIFQKSADKLTNLLNNNKDILIAKNSVFEKLFKDGKTLSNNWFSNTSEYNLSEAEVQTIINEVMRLDKSLVEQVKQSGGGPQSPEDFYDSVILMLDSVYFYIFLSNVYLFTYGASEIEVAYLCARQFAEVLRACNEFIEAVFSGTELMFENLQIIVPTPWSPTPILRLPDINLSEEPKSNNSRNKTMKNRRPNK